MDLQSTEGRFYTISTRIADRCDLPPIPAVAARALPLTEDPNASMNEVARVISGDVALAAQVLRIARSAIYAGRRQPDTLEEAVKRVGMSAVRRIVLVASARANFLRDNEIAESLWAHALATALAANEIERVGGAPAGGPGFMAGLFHDIGKLVFLLSDPKAFAEIGYADEAGEKERFGETHAAVGALLAERWGLDAAVVDAILGHHTRPVPEGLTATLATADWVAHKIGYGSVDAEVEPVGPDDETNLSDLVERVAASFEEERSFFG
jgi:putative nucleotidyltransferase with HDIG domain